MPMDSDFQELLACSKSRSCLSVPQVYRDVEILPILHRSACSLHRRMPSPSSSCHAVTMRFVQSMYLTEDDFQSFKKAVQAN